VSVQATTSAEELSIFWMDVSNKTAITSWSRGFIMPLARMSSMASDSDQTSLRGEGHRAADNRPVLVPVLTAGEMVSGRYRIERFIGRGGMGEVYEAFDTELRIPIALKTLRPEVSARTEFVARLKKELQLARRIADPNVCRVFDFGRHMHAADEELVYITMEFLEGETLSKRLERSGPFTAEEALPIARQIASGVTAAHRLGIIHRDLKSSNVILLTDDPTPLVKVTDFGVARTLERAEDDTLTSIGHVVGTPGYMAPEQLEGKATIASDVYAFGVVLHEMVTGRRPFASELHGDLRIADPTWKAVIRNCLALEPSQRFDTVQDALNALSIPARPLDRVRRFGSRHTLLIVSVLIVLISIALISRNRVSSTRHLRSIAVLPFINAGRDPNSEYLADGITDGLIARLSRIRSLAVMSRSAVFPHKPVAGKPFNALEIGRKLKVQAVLTGELRPISNEVAITAELVDVATGQRLWGEQYRRQIADFSRVEQAVVHDMLRQLQFPLASSQQAGPQNEARAPDFEAYREYLRGRYEWNKRTQDAYQKAIEHFRRAIDRDPLYAAAYSGLADAYASQTPVRRPAEVFPLARAAALKSIELDGTLAEGHASLALILLFYDWDWTGAEQECLQALELNPNYATAYSLHARVLQVTGRFPEALGQIQRAQELDPLSLGIATHAGFAYYLSRAYDRAAEQFRRVLEIEPSFVLAESYLAYTYVKQGRLAEAISIYERLRAKTPEDASLVADLGRAYALAGRRAEANAMLIKLEEMRRGKFVLPTLIAELNIALGDIRSALRHLEEAFEQRAWQLMLLKVEPVWDPLRDEPLFQDLLRRMRLEN
jgi:serine/threonine-protein kinase